MNKRYVYGFHAVSALLSQPHPIETIFINEARMDGRVKTLLALAKEKRIPIESLTLDTMNQQFPDAKHQGIVACTTALKAQTEADLLPLLQGRKKPLLILILDGITDPHNLGACLRSADAAGVDAVLLPKDKSASVTPVVSQVSCGAAESVPVFYVTNLVRVIEKLKEAGIWVYGAAGEVDTTLYELDCKDSIAMVLGAEGKGMRRLTKDRCDVLFALPMLGSVSSLNVSVATGVSLYEAVRQRQAL